MTDGISTNWLHQWQRMTEGQSGNLLGIPQTESVCRSYFGPDCIKDYVRDLLEIGTKHSIKINKAMIFTEGDKLHHGANDMPHL